METLKAIYNKIKSMFKTEEERSLEELLRSREFGLQFISLRQSHENSQKKSIDAFSAGYQYTLEFDNGYKILKISDHDRINWIGYKFINCLRDLSTTASYCSQGQYYVLVDEKLEPIYLMLHRTLSPSINLKEIRGYKNKPPSKKDYKYINAFLTKKNLKIWLSHKDPTFSDITLAVAYDQSVREERNRLRGINQQNHLLSSGINQVTDTTEGEENE